MEKTNIVIGFKKEDDPNPDIVFCGDVDGCKKAYHDALHGDKYHFVGMLRKPVWFKRGKPPRVQAERDEAHRQLEDELVRQKKNEENAKGASDKASQTVSQIEKQLDSKGDTPAKKSVSKVSKPA